MKTKAWVLGVLLAGCYPAVAEEPAADNEAPAPGVECRDRVRAAERGAYLLGFQAAQSSAQFGFWPGYRAPCDLGACARHFGHARFTCATIQDAELGTYSTCRACVGEGYHDCDGAPVNGLGDDGCEAPIEWNAGDCAACPRQCEIKAAAGWP